MANKVYTVTVYKFRLLESTSLWSFLNYHLVQLQAMLKKVGKKERKSKYKLIACNML